MVLHEVELSNNYKINNNSFFDENKFKNLIKNNNLIYIKEELIFFEKHHVKTEVYSFLHDKYNFVLDSNFESLNDVILNPLKFNQKTNDNISLYSTWFLFYLALNKLSECQYLRLDFMSQLSNFKFMEEYSLKKYYILFSNRNKEKIKDIKTKLNNSLSRFIKNTYKDVDTIIIFLKFLLKLHKIFFNNEQYKIMWNLESTYIYEIINILINIFSLEYKDIIEKLDYKMGIGISKIDSIYIELPKYISDNKKYVISKELINSINNLFNVNINEEELFSVIYTEEYYEILNSIIELQKRFFSSSKKDINLCLSILIGLVLSLEPRIKELSTLENKNDDLVKHLKNFTELNNCFIGTYKYDDKCFFDKIDILNKQTESIEKYLMFYRNSRNYLAHAKVDYFKLFSENNYIKDIIHSMLISIFFLIKQKG